MKTLLIPTISLSCLFLAAVDRTQAAEPNETFGGATLLPSGTLTVEDELTPGSILSPDTLLGIRGTFGDIYYVDDDGSPLGDGRASGVGGVSTNSGSIDFAVTGFGDDFFFGSHGEAGTYEVFVDVYDFFDDLIDQFSQVMELQPGNVDEYSFSNFEWIGGSYDVYIDNTVGGVSGADVDFFTFTGLTPGADFSAETVQLVSTDLDTVLGWFDDSGALLGSDDDGGTGFLSLLEGTVPASGQLTFAVSGYGDDLFEGIHSEEGLYQLQLNVAGGTAGDFDHDGDVDGRDFLIWQRDMSVGSLGDWKANYGAGGSMIAAVPEPATSFLLVVALAAGSAVQRTVTGR